MSNKKERIKQAFDLIIEGNINPSFKHRIKTCQSFLHPLENDDISNNLKGEHKVETIKSYLLKSAMFDVYKLYEKVDKCFGNYSVNPHKEYPPLDFFVKNQAIIKEFDTIIQFFENDISVSIFHVGNSGSGKTITQNCWLHTNNNLLEKKKIFWIRCDGQKLYELWAKYNDQSYDKDKHIGIREYLDIQLLYVFAKYSDDPKRQLFSQIIEEIKQSDIKYAIPDTKKALAFRDRNFIEALEEEIEKIKAVESSKPEGWSYAVDEIMLNSQMTVNYYQKSKLRWISLSRTLQDFLRKNGYKILKILDGLDNIDIATQSDEEFYKRMLIQAYEITTKKRERNVIYFLAMRDKTYEEFKHSYSIQTDTMEHYLDKFKIDHEPPCFKEISEERRKYIKQNNEFTETHTTDDNTRFIKIVESIIQFERIGDKTLNQSYHGDVRTFLYNRLSLCLQVFYRWKQLGRKDYDDYSKIIHLLKKRNKFLNGRFYLDSRYSPDYKRNKGEYCYNIFYSDTQGEVNENVTFGNNDSMCSLRILQMLKDKLINNNYEDIINNCNDLFGYNRQHIDRSLTLLKKYGLIDTTYIARNGKILFEISRKGIEIIREIFTNIDILYYLSLDTYLPKFFFTEKLLRSHINQLPINLKHGVLTNFISASTLSSLFFLSFVVIKQEDELEKLEKTGRFSRDTLNDSFALIYEEKSKKEKLITKLLSTLDAATENELDEIINTIEKSNILPLY